MSTKMAPIKNPAEYAVAIKMVSALVDEEPQHGIEDGDQLKAIGALVEADDARTHPATRADGTGHRLTPFRTVDEYQSLGALRWSERNALHGDTFKRQYLDQYRADFGYILPSCEVMQRLVGFLRDYRPVLDAGSGSGYLSAEMARLGMDDTIAVDVRNYREHRKTGYPIKQVHRLDLQADAVALAGSDVVGAVLLVWPPYDFAFALDVAKAMRPDQILVFEGEDQGGCTADDAFFEYVAEAHVWAPLTVPASSLNDVHVVMPGSYDGWKVWKKMRR
ncbi:MAG: hypothetical protein ABI606_11620 [Rhodoferax sp.]